MADGELRARRARPEDAPALHRFRCDNGGWFARDVQGLIRGPIATAVATNDPEVLLFFELEELVAVTVRELDEEVPQICGLHVVAIANDHQGTHTATDAGVFPLVKVVLDTALARAAELGATQVRTIVARDNARSIRMLLLQGFTRSERFDRDYDQYAARLG